VVGNNLITTTKLLKWGKMDPDKFSRITESLRQYRRAELAEFQKELGTTPIDALYVDPLPNNAILKSVLSGNTTFLIGRKGTGKSTIFAKAQNEIRNKRGLISAYIDVKALYELVGPSELTIKSTEDLQIDPGIYKAHILRKSFLGIIIKEIIKEIDKVLNSLSFLEKFNQRKNILEDLKRKFKLLQIEVSDAKLDEIEIPVLQRLTYKWKHGDIIENTTGTSASGSLTLTPYIPVPKLEASVSDFEKILENKELYQEYSEVILRTFPFGELIARIQEILLEAKMKRLVIFFDDFSELTLIDQQLFVDVILTPLNNSSNECIKLKIAGYPGRVYYGKIDPGKVDTITLDFSVLFETNEMQDMEKSAKDYAFRLLATRFKAFNEDIYSYFDDSVPFDEYLTLIFYTTFNIPRLMGILLHTCYMDKISRKEPITLASLRLASRKYYESTILQYFDRMNRYALEPFDNKLDRNNQQELLNFLISESVRIRRGIINGSIGGSYFVNLKNPPVSHFLVDPSLEPLFRSLEANFLLSKYKDIKDKSGNKAVVFALYFGITESQRLAWGYPAGREYRNYFVQRCFDYNQAILKFLSDKQTIRCNKCGHTFSMEKKESFEFFHWKCPDCSDGVCSIEYLGQGLNYQYHQPDDANELEIIDIDILNVLDEEGRSMRAGDISVLLDKTYQLIGKRTEKLQELDFVKKSVDTNGHKVSIITKKAKTTFFNKKIISSQKNI
jgi:hypothetical protein